MKKRLTLEVEEGRTSCSECPFDDGGKYCEMRFYVNCSKYNMHTLKLVEDGE